MSCLRPVADLKASNDLFDDAIGFRHTLVLSKVIEPGVRQEGLDELALLRGIFEYPPVISAVSTALARAAGERVQKRFTVLRIDVVFNCQQYRSTVRLYRTGRAAWAPETLFR
jgi:hypothetical protein